MFIGRETELDLLNGLLSKENSSLVVVYGRRRIGKTETIRHFVKSNNLFTIEVTGVHGATKTMQIKSFARTIQKLKGTDSLNINSIKDWQELFFLVEDFIETIQEKKKVIFLDEFPWLDSKKSNFLEAFSYFWNNFCTKRDDMIVIVCGSMATYMQDKFIKNKKTLHSRDNLRLHMKQFDLATSKNFLEKKGCKYSDKSIVDTYIAFGGVAKYLEGVDCSKLPDENIDFQCFKQNGLLKTEYQELYSSLFNNAKWHYKVMNLLSSKWSGYTQKELALKINTAASVIKATLEDLESSGFISSMTKFGQKVRDKIFRASDSFSYFHNKWMSSNGITEWSLTANTQQYHIWAGFAFENICHRHSDKIKDILGIRGVPTLTHYWNYIPQNSDEKGAGIDMLLEHTNGSNNIDIIECKYYNDEFTIDKKYYEELKTKIRVFNEQTNFKYNIRLIFISVYGVTQNSYYNELVSQQIKLNKIIN